MNGVYLSGNPIVWLAVTLGIGLALAYLLFAATGHVAIAKEKNCDRTDMATSSAEMECKLGLRVRFHIIGNV